MTQLLSITFTASEQLCELLSRAEGRCLLSIPEAGLGLAVPEGVLAGRSVEILPPVSADGGVKAVARLNLHGLCVVGFPQRLGTVYPGLRKISSREVETLPLLEVVDAADIGPKAAVFIDCPGLTSSLVMSLITASPRRFERIYFVLPDVPILDSESPSGDICSLLEASDYILMANPVKVGPHGKLYEANYDFRAARLAELEVTTDQLRLELIAAKEEIDASKAERESLLQRIQDADELQVTTDQLRLELIAAKEEIDASKAERESLLQRIQDADERLQGALDAEQKLLHANQLSQQITLKSQTDVAELRSRYEERVLEVEQLNGVMEQLQSRLEVAAGLYERLLEASPEALGTLGLDP